METTQSQRITARQCVAIIADNRANRKRADEAERKLATVKLENAELKARLARLEARYSEVYRKCVEAENLTSHWAEQYFRIEYKEHELENIILWFYPWHWDLWRHVANYANACLGRRCNDVS